jgi:hypothetical protein
VRHPLVATAALLALTAGLWLVHVLARALPTTALVALAGATAAAMGLALLRRAQRRRAVLLAAYVREGSVWRHRLRGGWVMRISSFGLGAALTVALLVAVVRLDDPRAWAALVLSCPALVATTIWLQHRLGPHASPTYLPELAWRLASLSVGTALIALLVLLAFHRPYPDFGTATLEQAVWHLADAERARSALAQNLLELAAAKDALLLWLGQQLMPEPGASLAEALGWLVLLAEESLFVWSYLVLCSAVLLWRRVH